MYLLGLGWIIWGIERAAQKIEASRAHGRSAADVLVGRLHTVPVRSWNPLDTEAWYYGRHSQRFRQSLVFPETRRATDGYHAGVGILATC